MKWALKKLIRLYPASWRKRYAAEFEALLEDTHPNWLTLADVLKGALSMQLTTWTLPRLTIACALLGAIIAAGIAFTRPEQYRSDALVKIVSRGNPKEVDLNSAVLEATSRSSLMQVINVFNLYQHERSRAPIEDVLDRMKKDIQVTPVTSASRLVALDVTFVYPDRRLAHQVTDHLLGRLIMANNRLDSVARLEETVPDVFPVYAVGPSRESQIALGLFSGTLGGILLFAISGRRRKYTPCPTCGRRMLFTASPQTAGESAGHP